MAVSPSPAPPPSLPAALGDRLRHAFNLPPSEGTELVATRRAAIALVLLEHEQSLEMLLIERAARSGDPWSGHMALPGGHVEPEDVDLWATAERETREEVGFDLRATADRIGELGDYEPIRASAIAVRPFVFLLRERPTLTLSLEVQSALWVPIAPLLAGEQRTTYTLARGGQRLAFPAWDIEGHVVWGLTYRVLEDFFRRFAAVFPPP
jgi:8-oxo-dGTP pyrophosphatase MutT (NUDIX family)